MSRPHKCRTICNPPLMKGYKPFGIPLSITETVKLNFEEYESFRLVNYEMLSQEDAALQMNVSRPTFTRIYNKALKTIALAFAEGKTIEIEGGNYTFNNDWYRCKQCYKLVKGCENHMKCEGCSHYSTDELESLSSNNN
jgi:uncharacterized protein